MWFTAECHSQISFFGNNNVKVYLFDFALFWPYLGPCRKDFGGSRFLKKNKNKNKNKTKQKNKKTKKSHVNFTSFWTIQPFTPLSTPHTPWNPGHAQIAHAAVCHPNIRNWSSFNLHQIQGRSQPHSPGWARVPLSSFFLKFWWIFLIFPQTTYFLPHFGSLGGQVAHPGRPWLRHWSDL